MTTHMIPTVFDAVRDLGMQGMQGLLLVSRQAVTAAAHSAPPCELYFDGACRGNPGTAGIGFLLKDGSGHVIETFSSFLCCKFTNNAAEYKALIAGLQHALDQGITAIKVYGDSELVCKQVNGEYKINKEWLRRYYNNVRQLLGRFKSWEVAHVRREENRAADALANQGIDQPSVDTSLAAQREVMQHCMTPSEAKRYVLQKRCEGVVQLQFILDTIKSASPESYAAVHELCNIIKELCCIVNEDKITLPGFQDASELKDIRMSWLLAQY